MHRLVLFFLCLAAFLTPQEALPAPAGERKLTILTTILPVYCFTANVAGDLARVENLLPPGVGPHDYQFTPRDLRRLAEADVIVLNGLELENWLERAFKKIFAERPPLMVEATAGLEEGLIRSEETGHHHHGHHHHGHGHAACVHGVNPHVWLDPKLAARCVKNILAALVQADPANAAGYEQNAAAYLDRLRGLDEEIAGMLAEVRGQAFVTYHDAFPYLVRRYGLRQVGVVEKVPEVQPSARYLRELSQLIRRENVQVIFTEPQFNSRLGVRLSRDLKVRLAELDPLETGPAEPRAYEEGMRHNAEVLRQQLGGKTP
jgi:zinc transport system substrate-binding protein